MEDGAQDRAAAVAPAAADHAPLPAEAGAAAAADAARPALVAMASPAMAATTRVERDECMGVPFNEGRIPLKG